MIRPDVKDLRSLKMFFEENKFLRTTELAQVAGVSTPTIIRWRKMCDIKPPKPRWHPGVIPQKKKLPENVAPNSHLDPNWLYQKSVVEGYGMHRIAEMSKRDVKTIWYRMKKLKIPTKTARELSVSKNPCCSREWLMENYVINKISAIQCSKMAGVCQYTIYNWLAKFNIELRDITSSSAGELNRMYGRKPPEKCSEIIRRERKKQAARRDEHNREIALQENSESALHRPTG